MSTNADAENGQRLTFFSSSTRGTQPPALLEYRWAIVKNPTTTCCKQVKFRCDCKKEFVPIREIRVSV
jgi:hypothetical protein